MSPNADGERFQGGAEQYAAYLETTGGRLRSDLTFANVREFLPPQTPQSLRALDIGGGTGAMAVRLARLGVSVTLLDSSPAMLGIAHRAACEAGVAANIELQRGDAVEVPSLFRDRRFHVILCHNVLEYVDHPGAVMRGAARVMGDSSAIVSVLVRNQAGEVLKEAIQAGDLAAAEHNLTADWGRESLFGGRVRLFAADHMRAVLQGASLEVTAERGVRVVSDYLRAGISVPAEYQRILELERKLGRRAEFAAVARYTQYLARRPGAATEEGA